MNSTKPSTSRIGKNPLEFLSSPKQVPTETKPASSPLEKKKAGKVRATFHLTPELFESTRDAVVALSGPPFRLTLAELAETAIRRELERLQAEYNKGKPFPKREVPLRGGRPIDS